MSTNQLSINKMNLEEFRKSKGYSYRKLAEFLGITGVSPESTVCRWCLKNRMPKPQNIKLILEKTNGKVKPASFYS
mgnify:CR=1 FL=1